MLTKRQKEVLDFVRTATKQYGYAPSLEEIQRKLKVASVSTAHFHIAKLREGGYLAKEENKPRSINLLKQPILARVPIMGTIAAGAPIEAIEIPDEFVAVPHTDLRGNSLHYALKVQGDSMIDEGIFNGDVVIIRKQETADNGQTVVAIIDDGEATLKKLYREKNLFRLQPRNQAVLPLYRKEVEVRGVVVKIIRDLEESNNDTAKYKSLRRYFDDLNSQQYHFVNSNDICTPMGCVEEMVDSIPKEFWDKKDLRVLDPCAGNGNFHAYIATKTKLENLVFNEINEQRLKNIRKVFGSRAKILEKDFLTFENQEEYDLVVANPPFAKFTKGERAAKNHNLSRDFVLKALNVTKKGGYILFIIPDNWMSLADRNDVVRALSQYQFRHLNIHRAKRWFPQVGSSFSWFLLQKVPNDDSFTVENGYKSRSTDRTRLFPNADYIPLYFNDTVLSIVRKTLDAKNKKYKIETSSDLHKFTKKDLLSIYQDEYHPYKIIHTPTQTIWAERPHKYQQGYKVFISLTNQYSTFIEKDVGATQSIAFIRCGTRQEAEQIKKELDQDLYMFLNNIARYGNFNNIRVLQRFPVWRDFGLTEKERRCIVEFNEQYRGTKERAQKLALGTEKR